MGPGAPREGPQGSEGGPPGQGSEGGPPGHLGPRMCGLPSGAPVLGSWEREFMDFADSDMDMAVSKDPSPELWGGRSRTPQGKASWTLESFMLS